jgi:hypothetical protein
MRIIRHAFIGAFLVTTLTVQAEPKPLTGRFQGSGRACYGTLTIQAKTISWLTPFSQCKSMSYELVDPEKHKGRAGLTYRLTSQAGNCRFAILSLTHAGPAENTGWEVTGYRSEQSYRADKSSGYQSKAEDVMSCYLVRNPEK